MLSSSRDNWERLVAAVIRREELWQLFHDHSRSPSISTLSSDSSSHLSRQISRNSYPDVSMSPLRPVLPGNSSPSPAESSTSGTIKRGGIAAGASSIFKAPRNMIAAFYQRKKAQHHTDEYPFEVYVGALKRFSLRELILATNNFSYRNIIGSIGYSKVYRGHLKDGSLVAVKRVNQIESGQKHLFQSELEILNEIFHPNVLRLLGFCIAESEWWIVYPFMGNGSVGSCLRERAKSQPPLDWPRRMRIAIGVARGLAYLHGKCDPKIIHRNVKAANILLDENFEVVIGDFELIKLSDYDDGFIETAVHGTLGHVAPEYITLNKCSEKTDVFAYGIFLLELITRRRAFDRLADNDDQILLLWVRRLVREKRWEVLVDSDLQGNYIELEVMHLLKLAFLCTRKQEERPKMSEIVRMLETGDDSVGKVEDWLQDENLDQEYISSMLFHIFSHFSEMNHENLLEGYAGLLRKFSLRELEVATEKFSNRNFLERRGLNKAYRGRLGDGSLVTVEKLKASYNTRKRAWIPVSNMFVHRNIIHLLGFCIAQTETLIVYPFMMNGSVASYLRNRPESQPPLDWTTRIRIATGTASGLAYLHEHTGLKIIHRDVKAGNILLDEEFEPVLSSFEFAKLMDHNDADIETGVQGTTHHIAPEYLSTGRCSEKTDVFAYGMFLLELITAQRSFDLARLANDDDVMLLDWVRRLVRDNKWEILVDSDLQGNYVTAELVHLLQLALLCTNTSPTKRPKMSEIHELLESGDYALVGRLEDWLQEETSDQLLTEDCVEAMSQEDFDEAMLREDFDTWWEERQAEDALREDQFSLVT